MTETFFKYLQFEKRLSKHTVESYRNDVNQFDRFVRIQYTGTSLAEVSYGIVRSWIITLVEEGLEPVSINRKIACLRSFYRFLEKSELVTKNPMTKVTALKSKKRLPSFIQQPEIKALLTEDLPSDSSFETLRDELVLDMFYSTGMRLSELINLSEKDINLGSTTLKVLGKRNKERVIPFPSSLGERIKSYLTVRRRDIPMQDHGLLFVTAQGDKCYPMMIYRIVNKRLRTATTADKKSPHILRHSYATHLLDRGAEINAVKDLLGHSSLAATQVYTHNSIEKLKKAFNAAHPKA